MYKVIFGLDSVFVLNKWLYINKNTYNFRIIKIKLEKWENNLKNKIGNFLFFSEVIFYYQFNFLKSWNFMFPILNTLEISKFLNLSKIRISKFKIKQILSKSIKKKKKKQIKFQNYILISTPLRVQSIRGPK